MSRQSSLVIRDLYQRRERSRFLRASLIVVVVAVAIAWSSDAIAITELFQARRWDGLLRFFREEALPEPLRSGPSSRAAVWTWFATWFHEQGWPALASTVPLAVVAIVLAGMGALPAAILGARATSEIEPTRTQRARSLVVRTLAVLARAIPEYILAFCLLSVLGLGPWPVVLALALHNGGILARLGADTIEDLELAPLRALRAAGVKERGVLVAGVLPASLARFLLYFFYRFETCLRESTALGLLGIVSLGYFVEEARAHQKYDELVLLMGLAAVLFAAADFLSIRARRWLDAAGS